MLSLGVRRIGFRNFKTRFPFYATQVYVEAPFGFHVGFWIRFVCLLGRIWGPKWSPKSTPRRSERGLGTDFGKTSENDAKFNSRNLDKSLKNIEKHNVF